MGAPGREQVTGDYSRLSGLSIWLRLLGVVLRAAWSAFKQARK